jgi:hypothetical protein
MRKEAKKIFFCFKKQAKIKRNKMFFALFRFVAKIKKEKKRDHPARARFKNFSIKELCQEIFNPQFFWQTIPLGPLVHILHTAYNQCSL